MATALKTNVTELPESRVRVEAEVAPDEIERRLADTARQLGRQLRIPGFRKGKVPPPVVIRRVGREAVLDEAVRDSLPRWYVDAIDAAGIVPIGDPTLDVGDLPEEGQPLTFTIEIGVRPKAELGEYKGIDVGRSEPEVPDEAIDQEIDALRERMARLDTVERAAQEGDFVVMDFVGTIDGEPFEGGDARDHMLELGSGRLIEGFEEQLVGAKAGDDRTVEVTFPEDYRAEHLAGKPASFAVTVKEVKQKELPELDDEFASDAAGFDTLQELRDDIRTKLTEAQASSLESQFREAAVDAAVANAKIEIPETLVDARASELFEQTMHSLAHRGISKEAYLQIAGKPEEEIIADARPDAEQALRREAVVAAIVEAEGIEPSDDDLLEAIGPTAEQQGVTPKQLLDRLRDAGRLEELRRDVASQKAVDLVAESANAIPAAQAEAREKIWTPESEGSEGSGGELWTPSS